MIRTKVPIDIRKYKAKIAGPFTAKQVVVVVILIIIDFLLYQFILSPMKLSIENLITVLFIIDLIIGAIGIGEIEGQSMGSYIKDYIKYNIVAPHKRKVGEPVKKNYPVKKLSAKELKENPEFHGYK